MARISQRIAFVTLLITTLAIVSSGQLSIQNFPEHSATEKNSVTPVSFPVPIELLGQGAEIPTPEELAKEQQFNLQQIAQATQWLGSQDVHQRIIGVEQLNAYQSPEAEHLLLKTLQQDNEPEVRSAATQSLGLFKTLSDRAIDQLIESLRDNEQKTRMGALDTLLNYATKGSMDNQRLTQITDKLTKSLESGRLDIQVSAVLIAFIADQKPVNHAILPRSQSTENIQ